MRNPELAAWLCEQRQRRAWSRQELARRLIKAARDNGDISIPSAENVAHNIYRWERGTVGPTERYRLYYCRAFGIPARKFGQDPAAKPAYPAPAVPVIPATAVVKFTAGVLGLWQEFLSEALTVHGRDAPAGPGQSKERARSDSDNDLTRLDDPAFLAERKRVREELEHAPANAALTARYRQINEEYDNRTRSRRVRA